MKDSTDWDWDNKCAKFLKKLTSKDDFKDSGTGQKLLEKSSTKTAATPLSQKKPVELPFSVKKSTSRERDARRSRVLEKRRRSSSRRRYSRSLSRSRKRVRRSRSRSRSRRSPDRRRRHSPSPILTKNSKSKVDSNGQQNNRNREPLLITPAAATPVTKAFSVTDETLPPLKSNQKVTEPRGSKQAVDPMDYTPEATLSAEEVQVLQQLAKKDPVALERFMLQNPQVLRALLNREEQQAKQQLKEKAKMPIVEDSRQVETPRRRVPLQPDPIVAQKSTASLRNNSQILSLQDELKDKLLTSNADHSNKQSLTRQSMPNQDYGVQKSAPSAEALLMKILADEEEKKRKQAQNEKMIYDLLKQVDEITNQSKNKQKPVCTPATAPTISWPPAEFDSLISDASLNVQQAKQQVLGYRGGGPSTVPENRSAAVNQSFSQQYSNFSFPSKADSTNSDLQNSLRAKYEQSRMEKNKELEMKRREAFDKLAKDLCAPNNAAAGFGLGSFAPGGLSSRSDPMEDIEQILNIARVQSQRSSGILPSPQQQQQPQQQQPRQSSNFDYSSYLGYNYQNRNGSVEKYILLLNTNCECSLNYALPRGGRELRSGSQLVDVDDNVNRLITQIA
uniref:Uncharacterized protein n=1 Tax=Romanomermis culicivorax TaxID=13658 RepID=A0A915IKP0_ROMCU